MLQKLVRQRRVSWRRLLATGWLVAAAAGLAGGALELWRFGRNDQASAARVESDVRSKFERMTGALARVGTRIASDPQAARALVAGPDAARTLFDLVSIARQQEEDAADISVTVYGASPPSSVASWTGRPSSIPLERTTGSAAYFVTPSPLGLRLVHVEPIAGTDQRRVGAVAVEHVLSPAPAAATIAATNWVLSTPLAPASLRTRYEGAGDQSHPGAFLVYAPGGEPLVEASVARADLLVARNRWRHRVVAIVLAISAITILLLVGPVLDRRAEVRERTAFARSTAVALALVAVGTLTAGGAWRVAAVEGRTNFAVPLLLSGLCAAAMLALLVSPVSRLRLARREERRWVHDRLGSFAAVQFGAGILCAILLVATHYFLGRVVNPFGIDLRHFSLHPWNVPRLLLLGGILALNMSAVWACTLLFTAAASRWRVPRSGSSILALLLVFWVSPAAAAAILGARLDWPVPALALGLSAGACAAAAMFAQRLIVWYRHTTVAARILALFVAFLVPALLLYPAMDFFAEHATRRLITTQYAVQAASHPQTLQDRLAQSLHEIDAMAILPDVVSGASGVELAAPRTDAAFLIWRQTVLARERLTSAIELYDRSGVLISRFALNFPEYTGTAQIPKTARDCQWGDVFGEAAPFGSEERRMLHAERNICSGEGAAGGPEPVGSIVVHVVFDYRTLPFISSQSPYFEVFRPFEAGAPPEGTAGGDVEIAIYGWGLRPLYTSGGSAWAITDELFRRIYASRQPFWTTIARSDGTFRVYFSNDRNGIYALSYPALSVFDHLVHLAELATLAGIAYVLVFVGTAVFSRIGRDRPRIGRALLREIRASFYRKLFLAFVLASIVPVVTLALVIRTYFASLLQADVEGEAARIASVAQRVIEESDALLSRSEGLAPLSDDVMVWIGQVIDQDVNVFEGPRLLATSERDLFASGLLPTRTPDEVYRAIILQRLPMFVGQDQIGTLPYMIAAAPVRAGGRDAILTVPLGSRQREIEREIDDLDRGVHLASLFFILLGAGIGLYMAERIADPVRRLTRATQLIAHGDFDARIAVKTADELKTLVDAFNGMAAELKAQRAQLERTNRLEAWAEMARQVAHEIKNPLTPIQLSAEHLRRVHRDRGEPLGEVLDGCITSILGQVRLLRQISAEFSSFASSPTARPSAVDIVGLVAEIVDPYRTGLGGRVEIVNRVPATLPRVYVDRTLVARALANIIENSLHAMPGTGVLTIEATHQGDAVTLRVRDTGVGMDEEALARVFEPYFSTKTTGTGLGLPIARRNVELSGGTVDVESRRGAGTTVIITLPVVAGNEGPVAAR